MLVELLVEDYAVVERLRVRFHPGLNLLTGETGSGKSLVVDALGLLFGGRSSADIVRTGAERARISGIFQAPSDTAFTQLLEGAGINVEDGELLLEREILANGKSRAFAGNRPATISLLRDLAPFLGDIHGQHDQQSLFTADTQLGALDTFGKCDGLVEETAELFLQWRSAGEELAGLEKSEQERLRLADLWRFQRQEIESAAPLAGEDEELEKRRLVLRNTAQLQENTSTAHDVLYDASESALAQIRHAHRALEEICRIDPTLETIRDSLKPAEIVVEEAAHELSHYLGRLENDPGRLEEVESRLAALDGLKRKYGATLDQVLRFLEEVRGHLDNAETFEERCETLRKEHARLAEAYESAAARLTDRRRDAARKLEKRVEGELKLLAMEGTIFRIELEPASWSAHGSDKITFMVSPNPGEQPRSLEKVASGGELSRIALALKTCLTISLKNRRAPQTPRTLVFDEVDSGVGGGAAEMVGRRLRQLADADQVLCVTHLPQIAGFAMHHFFVEKREVKGRAVASIVELTGEDRMREIGRMLSGQRLTPEALRHAEKLIKMAGK